MLIGIKYNNNKKTLIISIRILIRLAFKKYVFIITGPYKNIKKKKSNKFYDNNSNIKFNH